MRPPVDVKKKTANQEINSWLATVGTDAPLQHSNPASLYLASLQGSEASRTTARSVMKQIAVLCDQTPDSFPWHRLDRATVLALMEKLKQKGLSDNTRNLYLSIIKGVAREAMLHQQMSDHQFSLIEQIRAIKLQRLAVGRALHVDEIAALIDHCLHDEERQALEMRLYWGFYSAVARAAPRSSPLILERLILVIVQSRSLAKAIKSGNSKCHREPSIW